MAKNLLVPARKFLRLLDYLHRIGVDTTETLAAAGLKPDEFKRWDDDQLLPGSEYSALYRQAARQMLSLKKPIPWAAGIGTEAFELMAHAVISSKTLGDALDIAQRYDAMVYPMIGYRMNLKRCGDQFELHYRVHTESDGGVFVPEGWDRAEHYHTVAHASGLLVWYAFAGWLIGRSIDLNSVEIAGPPVSDAYREGLDRTFHCPLFLDAEENKLVAPAEYLDRRLVHTQDSLVEFLNNAVYELIAISSKPASTTAAIRSLIKLDFLNGIPSFEQMAGNLHMSESSLRRRLLKEDTSYQNIKDQVRCEIAIEHLRRDDTRINDLAELLGFTEPSSFVRSFRGWMGVTPKAYRDSIQ